MFSTVSVIALVALAACGDDDDGGSVSGDDTVAVTTTDDVATTVEGAPDDTGTVTTDATDDTGPSEPDDTASSAPDSTGDGAQTGPGENHPEDEGEPVKGGTLVFGLEADTANAWAPYRASIATSGYIPLSAVSDSLFGITDAGEFHPLLVESVETNDDYTEWTLHIREGINVPRRDAARRRRGEVQHRRQQVVPPHRCCDERHRHRHRHGPGRRDHDEGAVGRPPRRARVRVDRLHAVAEVAGQPPRRAAAHGGRSGVRRRCCGDPGRRRPGQAGGARRVRVRVVHAGQRQRVPCGPQRGLLAWPERDHR